MKRSFTGFKDVAESRENSNKSSNSAIDGLPSHYIEGVLQKFIILPLCQEAELKQ